MTMPVISERRVIKEMSNEIIRLKAKLAAADELLDGLFEEDLHSATGIPLERCKELLTIIREKPNAPPLAQS